MNNAISELAKLETAREACYDGLGNCNHAKRRKLDKEIRALAIQIIGLQPEQYGPMHPESYIASTTELVRRARERVQSVTRPCVRCGAPCRFLLCEPCYELAQLEPLPEPEQTIHELQADIEAGMPVVVEGIHRFS